MNNKLIIILALTWCSLGYANEIYQYDFETLYVQGNCNNVIITESSDANLKGIEYLSIREISLGSTPKSLLVKVAGLHRVISVPKNKAIKKIITMDKGNVLIVEGSGDVTAQIKQGCINLTPTIWGATDITVEKGDVRLNKINKESNIVLDLYAKNNNLAQWSNAKHEFNMAYSQYWFCWPRWQSKIGDSQTKKLVKVWAKDGYIMLNGDDVK